MFAVFLTKVAKFDLNFSFLWFTAQYNRRTEDQAHATQRQAASGKWTHTRHCALQTPCCTSTNFHCGCGFVPYPLKACSFKSPVHHACDFSSIVPGEKTCVAGLFESEINEVVT